MIRHFAAALLGLSLPTTAADAGEIPESSAFARDFTQFQALDARVNAIGWRLRTGSASVCSDIVHDTGLLLQDARTYANSGLLRREFSLQGDIFVQAVAPDSPAAEAGLVHFASVELINGRPMKDMTWSDSEPWARLLEVQALLEQSDRGKLPVDLKLYGKVDPVKLQPLASCRTPFEIVSSGSDMGADGARVRIGRRFPGFAYSDDELAAAMAHELAHNILRHPQWLNANGRKRRDVRETEREADRMMPWLLANAGYDPQAAIRFMERWGPKHDGGLFRNRTHDGWDERIELIKAEMPKIEAARTGSSTLNWAEHFRPRPSE